MLSIWDMALRAVRQSSDSVSAFNLADPYMNSWWIVLNCVRFVLIMSNTMCRSIAGAISQTIALRLTPFWRKLIECVDCLDQNTSAERYGGCHNWSFGRYNQANHSTDSRQSRCAPERERGRPREGDHHIRQSGQLFASLQTDPRSDADRGQPNESRRDSA